MFQKIRQEWIDEINALMLKRCKLYTPSIKRWVPTTDEGIGNTLRQKIWVGERCLCHCEEYVFASYEIEGKTLTEFAEWYYKWWLKDMKHRLGDMGFNYYVSKRLDTANIIDIDN